MTRLKNGVNVTSSLIKQIKQKFPYDLSNLWINV